MTTEQSDTEESCNAIIADIHMTLRVCAPSGERITGAALLRWRRLPAEEKAYFRALVAPHDVCRPPHPEPCDCAAPLYAEGMRSDVRCSRCLRAWTFPTQHKRNTDSVLTSRTALRVPLADWVRPADMGYAIERMGAKS